MTAQDFYNKYAGQSLLVPGQPESLRGQCFMLFDYWINEAYGLPYYYAPGAINIWENNGSYDLKQYFDFIPYSPSMPVKAGDVVVYGTGVGSPFGHVDVALQNGQGNSYIGMDQNWGHNLTVHQVNHNDSYNQYILGILRFKGVQPEEEPVFNEGDRQNVNNALYGYDKGFFKTTVGRPWKDSMYAIFQSDDFKNENTVNSGDVANINSVLGGDASSQLGQIWKQAVYNNILQNAKSTTVTKESALEYVNKNLQ